LNPPAFQFYADDFIAGTITMTRDERGLYIILLCMQWNKGFVTEDDFSRLGDGMAAPSLAYVKTKFQVDSDGGYRNQRLESVRAEQTLNRELRAKAGKLGAEKRWHTNGIAMAHPMANGSSPSPSPSPTPDPSTKRESRDFPEAAIPTWGEVKQMADMLAIPEATARSFFEHNDSKNLWLNRHGVLIKVKESLMIWNANERKMTTNGKTIPRGRDNPRLHGQSESAETKRASAAAALAAANQD
jgi:uncharacterized protein YdaU (DUF1376 family)